MNATEEEIEMLQFDSLVYYCCFQMQCKLDHVELMFLEPSIHSYVKERARLIVEGIVVVVEC